MTIKIISEKIVNVADSDIRIATIGIDDAYLWHVGNLPPVGDIQATLDANETEYLAAAIETNSLLPQDIQDQSGAKGWVANNPAAKLLFTSSIGDLETEITNLVNASFPLITAGQRTKWVLLLVVLALSVRVSAKRLGLLD